jgi:hypothetical protein
VRPCAPSPHLLGLLDRVHRVDDRAPPQRELSVDQHVDDEVGRKPRLEPCRNPGPHDGGFDRIDRKHCDAELPPDALRQFALARAGQPGEHDQHPWMVAIRPAPRKQIGTRRARRFQSG